jgi:hypothetical protein
LLFELLELLLQIIRLRRSLLSGSRYRARSNKCGEPDHWFQVAQSVHFFRFRAFVDHRRNNSFFEIIGAGRSTAVDADTQEAVTENLRSAFTPISPAIIPSVFAATSQRIASWGDLGWSRAENPIWSEPMPIRTRAAPSGAADIQCNVPLDPSVVSRKVGCHATVTAIVEKRWRTTNKR